MAFVAAQLDLGLGGQLKSSNLPPVRRPVQPFTLREALKSAFPEGKEVSSQIRQAKKAGGIFWAGPGPEKVLRVQARVAHLGSHKPGGCLSLALSLSNQ